MCGQHKTDSINSLLLSQTTLSVCMSVCLEEFSRAIFSHFFRAQNLGYSIVPLSEKATGNRQHANTRRQWPRQRDVYSSGDSNNNINHDSNINKEPLQQASQDGYSRIRSKSSMRCNQYNLERKSSSLQRARIQNGSGDV
jgi:hypothetical protein